MCALFQFVKLFSFAAAGSTLIGNTFVSVVATTAFFVCVTFILRALCLSLWLQVDLCNSAPILPCLEEQTVMPIMLTTITTKHVNKCHLLRVTDPK